MSVKGVAAAGVVAVLVTLLDAGTARVDDPTFWLGAAFVACWLGAAALVAVRGERGTGNIATVLFLICFPVAFSGVSANAPALDSLWRVAGSVSLVAFLYLFPRGRFEPPWTTAAFAASAAYLTARALVPGVATWTGDLVVFPLIVIVPLSLQVVRFRSASNAPDRRRMQIVGLTIGVALVGQLLLFAALLAGWLGPSASAEVVVEPVAHLLALLIPLGVALAALSRLRTARVVGDRLAGSGGDPADLLASINALAQSSDSGRTLVLVAADAIRESLRLATVSIDIDETPTPAADLAPATDAGVSRPITHKGHRVGSLRVTPRRGRQLSSGDRTVLDDLAAQLGPLVGSILLADQLDEARNQLFTVREEERRRLRADLHDELGATLAGLTLMAGLAGSLVDEDPGAARRLTDEIATNLQTTVGRVRELVEGLRPVQLDERGLDAAVRAQVERLAAGGAGMELRVHGHVGPGLPAEVELAAYRIAQEALTNAVRHSHGSCAEVDLAVDDPAHLLTVRVRDDGVGLTDGEPPGFGIQSMRRRAREVGGECAVERGSPAGVVVTAKLPLVSGSSV